MASPVTAIMQKESASTIEAAVDQLRPAWLVLRAMTAAVTVWWLASLAIDRPFSLPDPLSVGAAWLEHLLGGQLLDETLVSLRRLSIAYGAAAIAGTATGFAMAHWGGGDRAIGPRVQSRPALP